MARDSCTGVARRYAFGAACCVALASVAVIVHSAGRDATFPFPLARLLPVAAPVSVGEVRPEFRQHDADLRGELRSEPAEFAYDDTHAAAARLEHTASPPADLARDAVRSNLDLRSDPHALYASDLLVLEDLIRLNGLGEDSSDHDYDDGNGSFEPLELGYQEWSAGRLVALYLGPNRDFSFGYQVRVLPQSIGRLDALRVLDCGWNEIEELPETFAHLRSLEELRLHHNRLRALPANFGGLTRLEVLALGDNDLAWLPASIGDLVELRELHLSDNPLGVLSGAIGNLHKLEVLNVRRRDAASAAEPGALTGLPARLADLPRLSVLHLAWNSFYCDEAPPDFLRYGSREIYGLRHQHCPAAGN